MAAMKSVEIHRERLLLVEGKDDENFFNYLRDYIGIDIQVLSYDGKNNFRNFLST